jgi:tRNA A-37 threonylcarbamoyl transferase component Bud32
MALTLGRYELVRPLAQGGMAEVFLARRRTSGGVAKRLVIKRIRRERLRDPRFVNLFVQEARMSMSLAHKNIVPVFDFGRAGDELFLAMEYVDGPDLGRVLDQARRAGKRLDPMLVAYIGLEACQALDYAHNAHGEGDESLVHRDVTPRNVLISRAGEIKLVDFGVATSEAAVDPDKSPDRALNSESIRGTPAYMSPEQARGDAVDARSDLFSLGLILWEALAGRRAYEGNDNRTLLARARAAEVPDLQGDLPAPLARIVARATAENRDQRYRSSRDMQLALDEYLVSARAAAGGAPPSHALAEWLHAHPIEDARADAWHTEAPAGRVVTYLDDGEGDVLRGLDADSGTLRSIAQTMPEVDVDAEPDAEPESRPDVHAATVPSPDARADSVRSSDKGQDPAPAPQLAPDPHIQRVRARTPWLAAALALIIAALFTTVALRGRSNDAPQPASGVASAGSPDSNVELPLPVPLQPAPMATDQAAATAAPARPADTGTAATPASAPPAHTAAPPPDGEPAHRAPPAPARSRAPRTAPARSARQKVQPGDAAKGNAAAGMVQGTVQISATPWARVTVVGSSAQCTETPCTLTLPAGAHVLHLENPVAGLRKERTVRVTGGETLVVRETLTR